MTRLYHLFFNTCLPEFVFNNKLKLLSLEQSDKIRKFRKWEDAHASLFSKLLLLKGLDAFGSPATLKDLKFNAYGKPYIENSAISFNISHSGNCVVCVLSTDTACIGVDVEEIKAVDVEEFKNVWNENEWAAIKSSGTILFYKYWTRKEAVIKAEGSGLSIPLDKIDVRHSQVLLENNIYYLKELDLHANMVLHIASLDKLEDIQMIGVEDSEITWTVAE